MSHINKKTEEVTDMVASMGLTIHNYNGKSLHGVNDYNK